MCLRKSVKESISKIEWPDKTIALLAFILENA
jgi:hypothetical protein